MMSVNTVRKSSLFVTTTRQHLFVGEANEDAVATQVRAGHRDVGDLSNADIEHYACKKIANRKRTIRHSDSSTDGLYS